jgi:hypothetical protein
VNWRENWVMKKARTMIIIVWASLRTGDCKMVWSWQCNIPHRC